MDGSLKNTPYKSLLIQIQNNLGELPGDASDYEKLYQDVRGDDIQDILSKLHAAYIKCFELLNNRLPARENTNRHFHADSSRKLIATIETTRKVEQLLQVLNIPFKIEDEYRKAIDTCEGFLQNSNGSEIPVGMEKIALYYGDPIFRVGDYIDIPNVSQRFAKIVSIGDGSYATVHNFKDPLTNIWFVIKKAKKDLNEKEIERFKFEYKTLKGLSSPYIVDVYSYNEPKNYYLMEKMDFSLTKYLEKKPNLPRHVRKGIGLQIIKGFTYLHSKGLLHRDIFSNNILIKEYNDGTVVAKIADFGLVKSPEFNVTTINTTMKGIGYNDPELLTIGFQNYSERHELYAIVKLLYFVLTGKSTIEQHRQEARYDRLSREFVQKGTSSDATFRFASLDEIKSAYLQIFKDSSASEE